MKKEEKTQLTKEKILKAAIAEFGKNGYSGGSLNAVCATGINKGLIYHNFKNKDELFLACVKRTIDDMVENIESQLSDPAVSYSAARMRFFAENEMEARIFLEITVDPPEKLAEQIRVLRKPLEDINKREFKKLLAKQTMRKDISQETAYRWFSAVQDFYNLSFNKMLNERSSEQTTDENTDNLLEASQSNDKSKEKTQTDFNKRLELHEKGAAEFIDLMLYGIAVQKEDDR